MKIPTDIERYRIRRGPCNTFPNDLFGAFTIPGPCGRELHIIVSSALPEHGVAWEHASVSIENRCPNWTEMCFVKDLFWDEEETVMQLHPPKSQWVNNHSYCLHLWRPINQIIPLPPAICVGIKELGTLI